MTAVIVINYRNENLTIHFVKKELSKLDGVDFVVVVNNGATEDSDLKLSKGLEALIIKDEAYQESKNGIYVLSSIENLFCVGRNGQHRYNNIDHSMCTSFETVKNILNGSKNKDNIWSVNTEQEYHEASAEEVAEVD